MIFVVKVVTNKEEQAIELISDRAEKLKLGVMSVVHPHGLRGYVIIEAENNEAATQAVQNIPYVKGLIAKSINYGDIENMLQPVATAVNIEKGDVVEMLAEPFKREKAKVVRVDKQREEVVVELLEASVPIPITMKMDNVKVIRRVKDEGEEED